MYILLKSEGGILKKVEYKRVKEKTKQAFGKKQLPNSKKEIKENLFLSHI